ncbi:MAG: hypothetical protein EOP88_11640 [Verrucomicrobiaceae bacterium]|nr:MAG: hypothetical protein EOP88_11640 [Verrucomicrobiaceae bacterium]
MRKPWHAVAAGCVAAALGGYLFAIQPTMADRSTTAGPQGNTRAKGHGEPHGEHQEKTAGVTARTPQQLEAVKKNLIDLFLASPSAEHDWTLRAQAGAILATMSSGDLEAFINELATENKDAVFTRRPDSINALITEAARHWGLKDPENACLSAKGHSSEIFHDWLKRDPEAARAWINRGQFPPDKENLAAMFKQALINGQAATDLSAARESLALLDAEAQKKTLLAWSSRLAHDPARRDEFLALVASRGDAELTQKCHERLVREMAMKSPREAYDFIEGTTLPDEQKHALSQQMLGIWASKDPHKAFAAWAELKETEAPAPLKRAMDSWSLNSPGAEEAIVWVNKLDAGPAREQFKQHMLQNMSSMGRFAQAAELAGGLEDPTERIRNMKLVKRRWDEERPQGANEWFKKLPEADKEAMLK